MLVHYILSDNNFDSVCTVYNELYLTSRPFEKIWSYKIDGKYKLTINNRIFAYYHAERK